MTITVMVAMAVAIAAAIAVAVTATVKLTASALYMEKAAALAAAGWVVAARAGMFPHSACISLFHDRESMNQCNRVVPCQTRRCDECAANDAVLHAVRTPPLTPSGTLR